jgi:hypothetical protein
MVINLVHFGKYITNTLKVFRFIDREGLRRSVGYVVQKVNITQSQGGKERRTNDKKNEG